MHSAMSRPTTTKLGCWSAWLSTMMEVMSHCGRSGVGAPRQNTKRGRVRRKWRTFTAGGGITLGTVYDLAKRNGWKGKTPREPKKKNSTEPKSTDLPYSDAYNADLFARQHGKDFRWVDDNNHWLYWTGKRWVVDRHNIIYEKMKATILGLSANAEDDDG